MEYCCPVKIVHKELHTKSWEIRSLNTWLASSKTERLEENTSGRYTQTGDARFARPR